MPLQNNKRSKPALFIAALAFFFYAISLVVTPNGSAQKIKQLPPPLRRVIGDLSDKDKVLLGLEVRSAPSTSSSTAQSEGS